MQKNYWSVNKIDDLNGKRVVITGGSNGIGLESAKILASKGADVILAVRSLEKGERAKNKIIADFPTSKVTIMYLDLANLSTVHTFTSDFKKKYNTLDILINNAGVMIPPYKKTTDGFELQFGTNHLGHFVLTAELISVLNNTPDARVITLSSIASRGAKIYFDNLSANQGYSAIKFYGQSKLSNLLFGVELNKRLHKCGATTISIVCHPGVADTNLMSRGSGNEKKTVLKYLFGLFGQPAAKGALPTLFAATNKELKGGEFIGPDGWMNFRGNPIITGEEKKLFNENISEKLWEVSEKLTNTFYNI